jgi:hypothetical protein
MKAPRSFLSFLESIGLSQEDIEMIRSYLAASIQA